MGNGRNCPKERRQPLPQNQNAKFEARFSFWNAALDRAPCLRLLP
ncbi:MAG: hypothetical protein BJ554DRAFT_3602 [Olpidium bornovanus]|uniref:Uncharacterized protein n=1 Tax=Olpidium bornovanus TaxID=278681 RepID=A0A8H7ZNY2_9FUNG|nr:MAG: hypothetical protein BJ554DRAFT_3602 [Olpidium bornovanus]